MVIDIRVQVESVEIKSVCVSSVMSSVDPIRVDERNELENKVLSQKFCLYIVFVQQ